MAKIIFKRLTVKEKERVTAGSSSSTDNNIDVGKQTVGSGCILHIVTSKKEDCTIWFRNRIKGGEQVAEKLHKDKQFQFCLAK